MNLRYRVGVADLSGTEGEVAWFASLDEALDYRDARRERAGPGGFRHVHYRVTDRDEPERGDAEWGDCCGLHGAFGGDCDVCRQEDAVKSRATA